MDVQDFKDTFKYFTASYYDKDMKNSFIEKRNAVNKQSYKFNFEITDKDFGHSIQHIAHQQPPHAINLMISDDNDDEDDEDDEIQTNSDIDIRTAENNEDDDENDEDNDKQDEDDGMKLGDNEKAQHILEQGKIDIDLEADE